MDQQAEKEEEYKTESKMTRLKDKRGDSKVESNDSLEIPDRGETSDIPGLPSGVKNRQGGITSERSRRGKGRGGGITSKAMHDRRAIKTQTIFIMR